MAIAVTSARFEVQSLRSQVIRLFKLHTQDEHVKMENYDQRVIIGCKEIFLHGSRSDADDLP